MRLLTYLLFILLVLWALPASAQNDIHRCVDAGGRALFTDQTCAAMQATAVTAKPKPVDDATANATPAAPTEPPPILCASSYSALRKSVIDAFAHRNANRMAGLMLWSGYGSSTAVADIRALTALMQQTLLDVGPPASEEAPASSSDSLSGSAPAETAPAPNSQLILHLSGTDDSGSPRELRYEVARQSGCLWLRPTG